MNAENLQAVYARIQRVSRRPRFALAVLLALVELADRKGVVMVRRRELAETVENLIGAGGWHQRRALRRQRVVQVEREADEARAEIRAAARRGELSPETAKLQAFLVNEVERERIGDPTGQNFSRVTTELLEAGFITHREYVDEHGQFHKRPARGRMAVYHVEKSVLGALRE